MNTRLDEDTEKLSGVPQPVAITHCYETVLPPAAAQGETSKRVIEANRGIFVEEFVTPPAVGGRNELRYRVPLDEGIDEPLQETRGEMFIGYFDDGSLIGSRLSAPARREVLPLCRRTRRLYSLRLGAAETLPFFK